MKRLQEDINIGDKVIVFDALLWNGKDVGDNSQFFKPATIVSLYTRDKKYSKKQELLADVNFEHRGLSKGHFVDSIKKEENFQKGK